MKKNHILRQKISLYQIRTKFFLCIFLCSLCMTFIVDLTVYSIYRRDVEEKERQSMTGGLTELSSNIRNSVVSLEESIMYKITDCGIFDYQSELGSASAYMVEKGMRSFLELVNTRNVEVHSVYVKDIYQCKFYCERGSTSHENLHEYKKLKIYRYIEENTDILFGRRGTTVWRWFDDTPDNIYLVKSTVDQSTLEFRGILCIAIDASYFQELLKNLGYQMAIYDENGQLLYNDGSEGNLPATYTAMKEQLLEDNYIYAEILVPRENWILAGFTAKKDAFLTLKILLRTILLIELLVFAGMAALIFWISGSMTHNIAALSENFKRINEGKHAKKILYKSHDETAFLCEQFNSMQDQLKKSAEQIAIDSTLRERAEYNALMAQMNPHFLYNALESISSMAKIQKQGEIVNAIQNLSKLLRVSISDEKQEVPLKQEMEYIRQYLSLQNIVTGGKLSWDFYVEQGAEQVLVPKLILQPIVENSMIHGFEHNWENPMIVITAQKQGEALLLEVCDNGQGIQQDFLDRILEEDEPEKVKRNRAHIGIKNIQKRIQILYGKEYGMKMESSPGNGMIVKLSLPYRKEEADV